ncbi:MAG: MFS transporter [Gemmatimonadota bacterium]
MNPPLRHPHGAWAILLLLSVAELLGMSLWFTASATAPQLSELWGLDAGQAGWLTTTVQLGFVAGTALAALLNVADLLPSRRLFAGSALAAALVNGALVVAPGYSAGLALRFLTGFFLAGVYPPAMKMAATWFRSARGFAIGTIVGALTVGKALPYLVGAVGTPDYRMVVLTASGGALAAALLVGLLYRDGPFPFPRRPFSWALVGTVLRHRPTRLAIGGYLGHMWELYAMWTLIAVFFYDFFLAGELTNVAAVSRAGLLAFSVIAMGGIGAVLAGVWADRFGRERITIWSMAVSGACSLVVGWLIGAPILLVVPLALVWGFAIVADSAQFSAVVTEVAPPHAVGTALTIQTSLGFALTAGSIWLTIAIAEQFGWGPAFSLLAIGPVFGIAAMVRLKNIRFGVAPKDLKSGA